MPPCPLTDLAIRQLKAGEKSRRYFDRDGLYLELAPKGGKWWRLKYRFSGKEKRLLLGTYPETSLISAREKCSQARKLLASGIDPSEQRRIEIATDKEQAAYSLESVAREWFKNKQRVWAKSYSDKVLLRLENDLFPSLGRRPIAHITAKELLGALARVTDRDAIESAHRLLHSCNQIFRYAIARGQIDRNPTEDLRGALPLSKVKHHAAITDPESVGGLLRAIDTYMGSFITKCALRLAPLVFVRPAELRHAEWSEINLDEAEWNISAEKMKMRNPHLVPLSNQAISILKDIQLITGHGRYVFPSARTEGRPMSDNAILAALRRMGYSKDEMSGHGFRAMARTIMDEVLGIRPDYIEHQLAHTVRDPNGRAYNRTSHLAGRRDMMQKWADYLDDLRNAQRKN